MRSIIWCFSRFESEDIKKSTWPSGIREHREFEKGVKEFYDGIGIFLCIEKDDREEYLNALTERIVELNNRFYKLKQVIILPFVHLSNKIEHPKRAKQIIEKLNEKLQEKGFKTHRISFGTHKRFLWEIPGQVAEVSYFEQPYSGEKPKV